MHEATSRLFFLKHSARCAVAETISVELNEIELFPNNNWRTRGRRKGHFFHLPTGMFFVCDRIETEITKPSPYLTVFSWYLSAVYMIGRSLSWFWLRSDSSFFPKAEGYHERVRVSSRSLRCCIQITISPIYKPRTLCYEARPKSSRIKNKKFFGNISKIKKNNANF